MTKNDITITEIAAFCKKTGLIFPNSEIYGGFSGFFDYGPRGVEIKNAIKQSWWNTFVKKRQDVVGIDGTTITNPKVWHASGHVDSFTDPLLDCKKCKSRIRGDHIIEDSLKIPTDGMSLDEINKLVKKHKITCPKCSGELTEARNYNLMFKTNVGPIDNDESIAYLRPETAQVIFADFKAVTDSSRLKLPFGIAQIGKAYRNEIAPRDFLFRSREFEQMEIEYFVHPKDVDKCPLMTKEILSKKILILTEKNQLEKTDAKQISINDAIKNKIFPNPWLAYFIYQTHKWFLDLGIKEENLRLRQHRKDELAHYAKGCVDIDYNFPFGWKEIHGNADRGTYDLDQHSKHAGKPQQIFDEETKEKITPHVASEPSQGLDRAFLALLIDAYEKPEKDHTILKIDPRLSPVEVAVFPLVKKDGIKEKAEEIYNKLNEQFITVLDIAGSVGKRYYRMDEIGTPICITVDYDTKEDGTVTIRDRDTGKQARCKIDVLNETIRKLIAKEIKIKDVGKIVK